LFSFPSRLAHQPADAFRSQYEVVGNGEQFIVNLEVDDQELDPITVVLNWPAALKR
jgi:hypothetical protein